MPGRRRGRAPAAVGDIALLFMAQTIIIGAREGVIVSERSAALEAIRELGLIDRSIQFGTLIDRLRRAFAKRRDALLVEAADFSPIVAQAEAPSISYSPAMDLQEIDMRQLLGRKPVSLPRTFEDFPTFVAERDKLSRIRADMTAMTARIAEVQTAIARKASGILSDDNALQSVKEAYLAGEPIPELLNLQDRLTNLTLRRDAIVAAFAEQREKVARERQVAEQALVADALPEWRDRCLGPVLDALASLSDALDAEQRFRHEMSERQIAISGNPAWDAVDMAGALALSDRLARSAMMNFLAMRQNILAVRELNKQHRKLQARKMLDEICEIDDVDDVALPDPAALFAIVNGGR